MNINKPIKTYKKGQKIIKGNNVNKTFTFLSYDNNHIKVVDTKYNDYYTLKRYECFDNDDKLVIAYGLGDSCINDMYYFMIDKPKISIQFDNIDKDSIDNNEYFKREFYLTIEGQKAELMFDKLNDIILDYFENDDISWFNLTFSSCMDRNVTMYESVGGYYSIQFDYEIFETSTKMINEFKKEFTKFKKYFYKNLGY